MKKLSMIVLAVVMMTAGFSGIVRAQEAEMTGDPVHAQAAEDFLLAMQTPQQLKEGINSMVDMMLQAQPMMMPYRKTIQDFYIKYLSWEALKDDYIRITEELLTEAELKELTAFFKTEVGQKFIEKQPEMFQRTSELGFTVMQENQDELMQILQKEAERYSPTGAADSMTDTAE